MRGRICLLRRPRGRDHHHVHDGVGATAKAGSRRASVVPGLAVAAVGALVAEAAHRLVPATSPLVLAAVAGALATNFGLVPRAARPGLELAARRLLRCGVVLLGLRLSLSEAAELGWLGLTVVVVVVAVTFTGTRWLGARLGVSPGLSLLTATGFAVCGASAVAAMQGVAREREEDVAFAVALVTLFGTLALLVLPPASHLLGLDGADLGMWVGASVHDVAQVVATASSGGSEALRFAIVVKLSRVLLLAPLVALMSVQLRRSRITAGDQRPPVVPLFVVGFAAMVLVRSTGVLHTTVLDVARTVETALMAAALVGLGAAVDLRRLRRTGARPLLLGALSWALVAGLAYAGVLVMPMAT